MEIIDHEGQVAGFSWRQDRFNLLRAGLPDQVAIHDAEFLLVGNLDTRPIRHKRAVISLEGIEPQPGFALLVCGR